MPNAFLCAVAVPLASYELGTRPLLLFVYLLSGRRVSLWPLFLPRWLSRCTSWALEYLDSPDPLGHGGE